MLLKFSDLEFFLYLDIVLWQVAESLDKVLQLKPGKFAFIWLGFSFSLSQQLISNHQL